MQNIEKYVDQDGGLYRIGGNKVLYKRLLQSFLNDTLMDKLAEEADRGDIQAAARSAHAIKGVSANLSLNELSETIALFETGLKSGSCDKNALANCMDVFGKTKEAINNILNCD